MTQAIHLFNPATGNKGNNYIEFRCGRRVHKLKEKFLITQDTKEVTCIKCKNYVDNPLRILRRYGRITAIEDFAIVLNHDFGYKYDIVVSLENPGQWIIYCGINNKLAIISKLVGDFSTIPSKLAEWYEKNLLTLQQ
jgi:hypothetical protein